MAEVTQILSSNYLAVGSAQPVPGQKYVNVDPQRSRAPGRASTRTGRPSMFRFRRQGFRATVKYESGGVVKYQDVLIKDGTFRVGDTKFAATRHGVAKISTVMIKAAGGHARDGVREAERVGAQTVRSVCC